MNSNEQYKRILRFIYAAAIMGGLLTLFAVFWYEKINLLMEIPFKNKGNLLVLFIYLVIFMIFIYCFGGLRIGYHKKKNTIFSQLLAIFSTEVIMYIQIVLMIGTIDSFFILSRYMLSVLFASSIYIICLTNIFYLLFDRIYPPRRILVVYEDSQPNDMILKMQMRNDKFILDSKICIHQGLEQVYEDILNHEAVLIYDLHSSSRNKVLKYCFENSIRTYFTPKLSDIIISSSEEIHLFDTPLLLVRNSGLSFEQKILKRAMDIIVSIVGIILTSPIMLITALCIKIYDRGPVFFFQERITMGEKKFKIIKFRSMIVNAEKDGNSKPANNDDNRITPVGKFIRKTRIDELPQLLNILIGNMSIVGPRPERVEHVEKYSKSIPEFKYRLVVKGGLTGYAQIYGKYNTNAYDKLKMDLKYIQNYSVILDIKIMISTFKTIFEKAKAEGFSKEELEMFKHKYNDD